MLVVLAIIIGLAAAVIAIAGYLTKNAFVLALGVAFLIAVAIFVAFDEAMIHCHPPNCI